MKHFSTQTHIPFMIPFRKKPIVIHACQIQETFSVQTLEGKMIGKSGDYLVKGIKGELYIVDKDIFEQIYDKL